MDVESASSSAPVVLNMAPSKNGRTPGKAHKSAKTAKARSYISPAIKTPFEKRREADKKREAIKGVEKDMKEEKEAEQERQVLVPLLYLDTAASRLG
jgi:rRNA-processing protein CGR1